MRALYLLFCLAAMALSPMALAGGPRHSAVYDSSNGGALSSAGGALGGNLQLSLAAWVYEAARTTDATPYALSLMAGNAYAQSTGASQTGGSVRVMGGIGARQVTVSAFDADSTADTYVMTINGTATTLTARNGGAAAHEFNCVTSAAVCALALKTAVNTEALTVIASCLDGTCSDGKVYLTPTAASVYAFTHAITNSAGAVFGAVTSGTDGQTLIGDGSVSAMGLAFALDPNTGMSRLGADHLGIGSNSNYWIKMTSTGIYGLQLQPADIGASCTLGWVNIDTGGATTELCFCTATNTWKCTALAAGPAD